MTGTFPAISNSRTHGPRREAAARAASRLIAPLVLGAVLYILNNIGVLAGILQPPVGYQPLYMYRGGDIAVYLTWLNAFQDASALPNYHAPWVTEPALFNPLMWLLARSALLLFADVRLVYHAAHFLFHIAAAYALFALIRAFMSGRKQQWLGGLAILLTVPLFSLAVLPVTVAHGLGLTGLPSLPGFGDFMWWSSDGFVHGIAGSIFVTFGTATVLAAFACLANYLRTEHKRDLICAGIITAVSAFVHPYEVVVIVGAGAITLLLWRGLGRWRRGVTEAGFLTAAGGLGVLPLAMQALDYPWLRAAAEVNRWQPPNPIRLLSILGLPAILVLALIIVRRERMPLSDKLLGTWFLFTLVGLYVPWMHWSQHLLDGFHYVASLLLVRMLASFPLARASWVRYRSEAVLTVAGLTLLSATAYLRYYHQAYLDGSTSIPAYGLSSVAPVDEVRVLAWLDTEADSSDLVLAPARHAPWVATVPMHSFASHFAYSLSYAKQSQLSEAFFAGELSQGAAENLLAEYGVRYVVVPDGSPAATYLDRQPPTARFGNLSVYALETSGMKPYPGLQGRE